MFPSSLSLESISRVPASAAAAITVKDVDKVTSARRGAKGETLRPFSVCLYIIQHGRHLN